MTLLELIIAMIVASIVLYTVIYTWNNINLHVAKSKFRTELETETNRIGSQIISHIRKSQSILEWNDHRILLLSSSGCDTLDYCYNGSELLLNGKPITILIHKSKVSNFELKNLNEQITENEGSLLLNFTLTIVGMDTDSATVNRTVQISQRVNKSDESGNFLGF
jgi:hypothetical protein